jgi:predicted DNA-binding transcriptional regulator YafY
MRKASRLFEIIQIVRLKRRPVTALEIAEALEVTPRTIYRDIAALQAMRVPIEGGRGIGYILRPGFNLPPLMFSIEETEAIVLSLAMIQRTGDRALKNAAQSASQKIEGALPVPLRETFRKGSLYAWGGVASAPEGMELSELRMAIRDERKLNLEYRNEAGEISNRTIWPIAMIYYTEWANVVAWCELRQSLRTFRTDRVVSCNPCDDFFTGASGTLRDAWMAGWETDSGAKAAGARANGAKRGQSAKVHL